VEAKIRIDYFKPTGKWYGVGEFFMDLPEARGHVITISVPDRIDEMRRHGERPGLVDRIDCPFVWVVKVIVDGEVISQYLWQPEALVPAARKLWG